MKAQREGINALAKPSGTGCVECLATGSWWLHLRRCAECGQSAAVIIRQISMHRNITPLRVTRLSRVSSRGSAGFTTTVQANFLPALNLPAPHAHPLDQPVTGAGWGVCPQTGKRCSTNRGAALCCGRKPHGQISASQGPGLRIRPRGFQRSAIQERDYPSLITAADAADDFG